MLAMKRSRYLSFPSFALRKWSTIDRSFMWTPSLRRIGSATRKRAYIAGSKRIDWDQLGPRASPWVAARMTIGTHITRIANMIFQARTKLSGHRDLRTSSKSKKRAFLKRRKLGGLESMSGSTSLSPAMDDATLRLMAKTIR
jgi:hypothetical protein